VAIHLRLALTWSRVVMAESTSNNCTPSTTFEWRRVKIDRRRAAPGSTSPEAASKPSQRSLREPVTITVHYRGGSEAWWELKARGRTWRRPGSLCLHDVLADIYAGARSSS